METFSFPSALRATSQTWRIDSRTRSGGETVTGREQVVSSGLGRWKATLSIALFNRDAILAHQMLLAQLDGRANAVRLPFCLGTNGARVLPLLNGLPYAGKDLWLRPGLRREDLGVAPKVRVTARAGATEIVIDPGTLSGFQAGVAFGLGERLYLCTEYHGGAVATIKFRPKLRFQINAGTLVVWKSPRCIMRLASDDSGLADIQIGRYGTATFDFVEVW